MFRFRKYRAVIASRPLNCPNNTAYHPFWYGKWRLKIKMAESDAIRETIYNYPDKDTTWYVEKR